MLCLAVCPAAGAMVVAERGQARAVIVVAADARPREMLAAQDLAHYLGAMTGATFEIRSEARDGPCIFVGQSDATTPILQELRDRNAPADSFIIRCEGDRLYLVGSDVDVRAYDFPDEGTCNAVYTFLDELGCRWYFTGEHSSYLRLIDCTTLSSAVRICEVRHDQMVAPDRESPMLAGNRVFMASASGAHSLSVLCQDDCGVAVDNLLYSTRQGDQESAPMLLFGVPVQTGNQTAVGDWRDVASQRLQPYFLRATFDTSFRERATNTDTNP